MKKLDLSPIAPGISMYVKGGTLQFLQLAYQEAIAELASSRIGSYYNTGRSYILNGCINSGSGSNYIISAGSIFFNGEVYLVPAVSFTITGSNIAVGSLSTTQYIANADPTDFTDGNQRNVHNIRQIEFGEALSGSGIVDFNNLVNLAYKPVGAIGQTTEWLMPGGGSQNSLLPTYFDSGTLQGIHPLTLGWIIDDIGGVVINYKDADSVAGVIGATGGANTYKILTTDLPALTTSNNFLTAPGSGVTGVAGNSNGSALGSFPVNGGSPNNSISLLQKYKVKLKITRYA